MAGEALRVLGFAYAEQAQADQLLPKELIWLGLTGMADPVRQGDEGAYRVVSPSRHQYDNDHR